MSDFLRLDAILCSPVQSLKLCDAGRVRGSGRVRLESFTSAWCWVSISLVSNSRVQVLDESCSKGVSMLWRGRNAARAKVVNRFA